MKVPRDLNFSVVIHILKPLAQNWQHFFSYTQTVITQKYTMKNFAGLGFYEGKRRGYSYSRLTFKNFQIIKVLDTVLNIHNIL